MLKTIAKGWGRIMDGISEMVDSSEKFLAGEKEKETEKIVDFSVDDSTPQHRHQWYRGMLPGSKCIKTCHVCLVSERITQEQFENLL
jgi:hypothetical protein